MPRIATINPAITPVWNRASRYGAVVVIIVCTVIALRPLMTNKATGHARPVTPASTHHLLRAACASALKGHFVFISYGTSSMNVAATCKPRRKVLQNIWLAGSTRRQRSGHTVAGFRFERIASAGQREELSRVIARLHRPTDSEGNPGLVGGVQAPVTGPRSLVHLL